MNIMIRKLLYISILVTSLALLSSCGGDGVGGTGIKSDPAEVIAGGDGTNTPDDKAESILEIPVAFREHGYSKFETKVITSQTELNQFIDEVDQQKDWNNKADFIKNIQAKAIDFDKNSLLLYRLTEGSGGIELTPHAPTVEDSKAQIVIDRVVPEVGDADMAYYLLAYQVDKKITAVVFTKGSTTDSVKMQVTTNPAAQGKLVRSNEESLSTYFHDSFKQRNTIKGDDGQIRLDSAESAPIAVAADASFSSGAAASTTGGSGAGISTTNIQEKGVDEADLIKTNGRYIFSVKKPSPRIYSDTFGGGVVGPEPLPAVLLQERLVKPGSVENSDVIRIMDTQGTDQEAGVKALTEIKRLYNKEQPWNISGLYLHNANNRLIALSSARQNYWRDWFNSFYFASQKTELLLIDVKDPASAEVKSTLSFEGQLIDSRRNGDTLYMVLRHYPNYPYIDDEKLLATHSEDFLPTYSLNDAKEQPISKPDDCYIEEGNKSSADIITLVAIDLTTDTPQINSECYVGSTEAIYASQNALYLATTRWDYQVASGVARYGSTKVTTDIHKFAYNGLDFDYRGSGEVDGHLGFKQASKSFRFSEHEGALRVVTFDEDQWVTILPTLPVNLEDDIEVDPLPTVLPVEGDGGIGSGGDPIPTLPEVEAKEAVAVTASNTGVSTTSIATTSIAPTVFIPPPAKKSPVSLSILKENTGKKALEVISKLPNVSRPTPIGLPGEQLYATRFIGHRGYVVTFRITDPLYVLDLTDPTDPFVAGELKIDGYSDYLHPITDTLLLGVGKDAVPASRDGFGDGRGAWYQGVKLSLIDVTDPANPREADKVVLGKRGTESTALYTHHGLTSLRVGNRSRIAIPVQLHEGKPAYDSEIRPSTYYSYQQTGLYRFEIDIDNQHIDVISPMIVNQSNVQTGGEINNDRSVLIKDDVNDDVYYMHNGQFWLQDWLGSTPAIGPK